MEKTIRVVGGKIVRSITKSLPWVAITGCSIGLYALERKRVDQMLKLNAEREDKTNAYNVWLKNECDRMEGKEEA